MPDDCIFCAIAAGEGPATILDEDEQTVSFLDINPWTRGHSLVIPRAHSRDLLEIDDADLAATASAAKRLATRLKDGLDAAGINLVNSCGAAAWQSVFHFHIHVIPRYEDDPMQLPARPQQADPDELAALAEQLR